MTVVYNVLERCEDIDQSKFADENWYLMGWGMGDAINAILFLESQSVSSYKVLCPPRNHSAIKFILDNFISEPKCEQVDVYPLQDGYPVPQEEVLMSCNGFGPQNIKVAHTLGKLKVVHTAVRNWPHINDLEGSGILQQILDFDNRSKTISEKTCILFPERGDSYQFPDSFWEDIVSILKEKGYKVYVNSTTKSDVYKYEKIFDGTEKLDKTDIGDLFNFVAEHQDLITIGQRSGIFDFLKYFACRKIIFYPDVLDPKMPDKERMNVPDVVFSDDRHAKNTIDLCLSTYDKGVLNLIIP